MTPNTFIHRGDLVNEINKLGALYDVKEEVIDNQHVFMLCCSNMPEKCDAKILGIFSQKDRLFRIQKIESFHSCTKNTKKDAALCAEIQKHVNITRTGELVQLLNAKFKVGYYEVFKAQRKGNLALEFFDKENLRNTGNLFLNELGYNIERDCLSYQKTEDFKLECNRSIKKEITSFNEHVICQCTRNSFFFKHTQMNEILRPISEIKIYPRAQGTFILGLLFDPCDDYIINSFLISEDSKTKALETFLECDKQTLKEDETQFFIVDLDMEVIQFLISKNIPFFIKSRAISMYLQGAKEEDPHSLDYFNILNYGNTELIDLDKQYYLKKFCPINLYNLNNCQYPDFDYITGNVLTFSLVDLVVSLMWLISTDIKNRKNFASEELENKFSDAILSIFDDFNENVPSKACKFNLKDCWCECGKFQENLFPCIHAYQRLKESNIDPFLYVSSIYCRDNILKIKDIIPIVNIKIHPNKVKNIAKKKRTNQNESDEV